MQSFMVLLAYSYTKVLKKQIGWLINNTLQRIQQKMVEVGSSLQATATLPPAKIPSTQWKEGRCLMSQQRVLQRFTYFMHIFHKKIYKLSTHYFKIACSLLS
jgi:hypothetical protein